MGTVRGFICCSYFYRRLSKYPKTDANVNFLPYVNFATTPTRDVKVLQGNLNQLPQRVRRITFVNNSERKMYKRGQ